jgi:predicted GTPase
MGYGEEQMKDLETIYQRSTDCDSVVIGTPIDLGRFIKIDKPNTRVYYELSEIGAPTIKSEIAEFLKK